LTAPTAAAEGIARILPARTRVLATFPGTVLRAALAEATTLFPRQMLARAPEELSARMREVFGTDLSDAGPGCAVAWIAEAGPLLACDGGTASPPAGAVRWSDGPAEGWTVARSGREVGVARMGGRLLAGTPEALRVVVQVARKSWPALAPAEVEAIRKASDLAAIEARRPIAVLFPDRTAAPWCAAVDACLSTAIFADAEEGGVIAVGTGSPEAAAVAGAAMEAFWRAAVAGPVAAMVAAPARDRPHYVGDGAVKLADLPARTAERADRGEVAAMRVRGRVSALAAALRPDVLETIFGEPRAPAPPPAPAPTPAPAPAAAPGPAPAR
jgi:hypothetical protein